MPRFLATVRPNEQTINSTRRSTWLLTSYGGTALRPTYSGTSTDPVAKNIIPVNAINTTMSCLIICSCISVVSLPDGFVYVKAFRECVPICRFSLRNNFVCKQRSVSIRLQLSMQIYLCYSKNMPRYKNKNLT